MADAQQFLVSKPDGKPLVHAEDLIDAIGSYGKLSDFLTVVTEVTNTGTADTILPWRVIREDRTVAAVEDPEKALAVLQELADDLTLWRLEFHTAVI